MIKTVKDLVLTDISLFKEKIYLIYSHIVM